MGRPDETSGPLEAAGILPTAAGQPEQPEPATGPVTDAPPKPPPVDFTGDGQPAVLSVVPPAGSLTVDDVVITTVPAEVSADIATRAREAAWLSGIQLKEG